MKQKLKYEFAFQEHGEINNIQGTNFKTNSSLQQFKLKEKESTVE